MNGGGAGLLRFCCLAARFQNVFSSAALDSAPLMPHNRKVSLRHLSLFVVCVLSYSFVSSCQKSISSLNFDFEANRSDPISQAIEAGSWEKVLKLSHDSRDPLLKLIELRALYELKRFSDVLAYPAITDSRFSSYDIFLRTLSAFESSKFDEVSKLAMPDDLPTPLKERIWLLHGEALQEKMELEPAKNLFEKFLKTFKHSAFRGDILIRLADIDLSLGDEEKSAERYKELYEFFPLTDSEDIARQRLIDSGHFSQIDTDAHLTRIQQLRKSANFKRAYQELQSLLKGAPSDRRHRIELAMAQVRFGERNYSECLKLAKKALSQKLSEELE
ncbi:MAG: hypothetical protein JWQ35_99, partial [Bacteriovoracaceae bacterium]|nr:hypothetical protein [Bacteriovoracaceae bacterium]